MANLTLVYGMRLLPAEEVTEVGDAPVKLKNGHEARVTMHILEGSREEIEAQLRQSIDAFFEFYPKSDLLRRLQARTSLRESQPPSSGRRNFSLLNAKAYLCLLRLCRISYRGQEEIILQWRDSMAASAPSKNANPTTPAVVPWKPAAMHSGRPRVLILGAGFAGIHAAQGLAKLPVDVTLVDRRNHHTFQPLLYQVALAVLSPANIAQSIRTIMRDKKNVEVLMDEAVGFDIANRQVQMKSRALLEYDYLLVATGSTHSYFGKDEWAKYAPGLKTIEDATEIRRRVLLAFELAERQMLETGSHPPLNFVIIGGGPTGVELAGAISDIARLYMRHDFRHIDPSKARVTIYEGSPRILSAYPEDLSAKAVEQLKGLDVEVHTNAHVTDVQPGYVMVGDQRVDSVVTLWAAGVQASPLGKLLGVETDRRGCVMVNEFLNPAGHPEIFVAGDLAHVEEDGHQIPGVAQPALQMGKHVARDDQAGPREQAANKVPLLRQGRHGNHRKTGCRRENRMAL